MREPMNLFFRKMKSPIGDLTLVSGPKGLLAVSWEGAPPERGGTLGNHPTLLEAERQLREYFEGRRIRFELPLEMEGSPFQLRVWKELQAIPFGKTRSYGEIAERIGRPKAFRAVGSANGRNPLGIVVPCHRVIGANGELTGFAGGLEAKTFLLKHEARVARRSA